MQHTKKYTMQNFLLLSPPHNLNPQIYNALLLSRLIIIQIDGVHLPA